MGLKYSTLYLIRLFQRSAVRVDKDADWLFYFLGPNIQRGDPRKVSCQLGVELPGEEASLRCDEGYSFQTQGFSVKNLPSWSNL